MAENDQPLLVAENLSKNYGRLAACRDISFTLYSGEVLAIVGESGSGKTTLLQMLSAQLAPTSGSVSYRMRDGVLRDLNALGEAERRFLFRTDWGYVHQDPALGASCADSNCNSVDLPEPDSPTIASTSPGYSAKDTSRQAFRWP